jgi:hypothetical protein
MSRISNPPRRSNARIVAIVAGAALIGTIVGGASAVGVVMAIVQPPTHDIRADTALDAPTQPQPAQAAPPSAEPVTATASVQNPPAVPASQSGPASTTQQPSPSATWPDALSARTDHGAAATAAPSTPLPQASPAARDPNGSQPNDERAAQDHTVPAGEPTVAERAPWPNPVPLSAKAVRRHTVTVPPAPEPVQQTTSAPAAAPNATADKADSVPTNKTQSDSTKPRLAQQQPPRSRAAIVQGGDDRDAGAYPPRQRVIILPGPERDASTDREDHDNWDHGNGLFGLFDSFGHDHWNDNRWNDDRWHDDQRD